MAAPILSSMSQRREVAERADDSARESALTEMVDRFGGKIYALGMRLCGNAGDAEDLVQETFLQAHRKWHQFRGDSKPSTWLYTIAARVCIRHRRLRSGEPRRMESFEDLLPAHEKGIMGIDPSTDPERWARNEELRHTLETAIARLPPAFRLPLTLKELMELSVDEVAAVLSLKPSTVKTRLHRARLFLARELRRKLPAASAPPPDHSRQMCLDLLKAKQDSLDRGVKFPVNPEELCSRCRSLFASLDLTTDVCMNLREGELPEALRELVETTIAGSSTRARTPRRK